MKKGQKVNLHLNSKKEELRELKVKFMEHIISQEGLKPDSAKVKVVEEMSRPTCKQELLSLLGFQGFCHNSQM